MRADHSALSQEAAIFNCQAEAGVMMGGRGLTLALMLTEAADFPNRRQLRSTCRFAFRLALDSSLGAMMMMRNKMSAVPPMVAWVRSPAAQGHYWERPRWWLAEGDDQCDSAAAAAPLDAQPQGRADLGADADGAGGGVCASVDLRLIVTAVSQRPIR